MNFDVKYQEKNFIQKIFKAVSDFKKRNNYEFAIKETVNGTQRTYSPVVKEPGIFAQWRTIVQVYDSTIIWDHEVKTNLSSEECLQHIEAFKQQLEIEAKNSKREVNFHIIN